MPNKTSKLKLNTFLENEAVDYTQVNENFEILDKCPICTESGEKTSAYTGASSGNATWYYRKYSDGTVDLYTKIETTALKCSSGASAPYYSDTIKLVLPIELSTIYSTEINSASEYLGWMANVTGKNVNDYILFRAAGAKIESSNAYKCVFIHIKGRG